MVYSRFFVEHNLADHSQLELTGNALRHLQTVLRLKPGAKMVLFDGAGGECLATLESSSKSLARLTLDPYQLIDRESPLEITLIQGLARGKRMQYAIQKATELGVARIIPAACEFSAGYLKSEKQDERIDHWRRTAIAACEQSQRNRIPEILPIMSLTAALDACQERQTIILEPSGQTPLSELTIEKDIAVAIGPEGGFSEPEISLFEKRELDCCHVGPRLLRTETAAAAAIIALQTLKGAY